MNGQRPPETLEGKRARLEPAASIDPLELLDLDWARSLHPAMGGWMTRPPRPGPGMMGIRDQRDGAVIGVLDAVEMTGYPGVVSVSVYTDPARRRAGTALEAYALFVTWLFEHGARLIHHEVLELNHPIQRILRGIGVPPSARFRHHAYAAGQFWDVLVYSFDAACWDRVRTSVVPRAPGAKPPALPPSR